MTIMTHILITSLGVKAMNLSGNDLIYAYAFGVLPDLDHIVKIPSYIKDNGFKIVRHYKWRTFLQEPVMLLLITLFSIFVRTWVPVVFFSLHLILDYLMSYEKSPFAPFFDYKTKGFMKNVRDSHKEAVLMFTTFLLWLVIG